MEQNGPEQIVRGDVRCLHIDYDQPPYPSDVGLRHRRCAARVAYEPEKLAPGRQYLAAFCFPHRPLYTGDGPPATPAEVKAALARLDRWAQSMTMPAVAPEVSELDEPTDEALFAETHAKASEMLRTRQTETWPYPKTGRQVAR